MPQFFVTPEMLKDIEPDQQAHSAGEGGTRTALPGGGATRAPIITIRGKEARHLRDVLRLDVGDWVVVCDGAGQRYRAEITESRPLHVTLRRGDALPAAQLPAHITLAAAVIRPQRFDWLVEKSFELGCRRLIPLTTERTVAHYIKDARRQHARWEEIAVSAAKQSGLPWMPEVAPVTTLSDLLASNSGQLVYCWEGLTLEGGAAFCGGDAERGASAAGPAQDAATIMIGPEGGFSATEHDQIMAQHPKLLSLGPLILRSETAALTALVKVMQ